MQEFGKGCNLSLGGYPVASVEIFPNRAKFEPRWSSIRRFNPPLKSNFVTRHRDNSGVLLGRGAFRIRRSAGVSNSPKPPKEFRKRLETELRAGLNILSIPASDVSRLIDGLDREYEDSFHIASETVHRTHRSK